MIGVVLMPMLAAVGALAALVCNCTIEVERCADSSDGPPQLGADLHQHLAAQLASFHVDERLCDMAQPDAAIDHRA